MANNYETMKLQMRDEFLKYDQAAMIENFGLLSDDENIYYSYLIRSAMIHDSLVIGPHNVLESILKHCKLDKMSLESKPIELITNQLSCDVFFSKRINLAIIAYRD